jgi:hypothetical protein
MALAQQPNTQEPGAGQRAPDRVAAWAAPQDPKQNTRPPGNGDRDAHETEKSEQKLLDVLGR